MIYLCVGTIITGVVGFLFTAFEHYEAAGFCGYLSWILCLIFIVVLKCSEGEYPYAYREERCSHCGDTGKVIKFSIGLGQHGLMPSYTEVPCPRCRKENT